MNFRPFTPTTHQELAQLLADSGSHDVCIEHFTNEGYDPEEIRSRLSTFGSQLGLVGKTNRVGEAALPRNVQCPEPGPENGVFTTPAGARILFEMKDPHVVLFDNFLTPAECDHLVSLAAGRFRRSQVVGEGGETVVDNRSSDTAHLGIGQDDIVRAIEARIAATVHWPILKAESLQVIKYEPGQEYKPHYDFFDKADPNSYLAGPHFQRTGTMILYLKEPTAGGSTSFPRLKLTVPALSLIHI